MLSTREEYFVTAEGQVVDVAIVVLRVCWSLTGWRKGYVKRLPLSNCSELNVVVPDSSTTVTGIH